jgi:hypothetical protein
VAVVGDGDTTTTSKYHERTKVVKLVIPSACPIARHFKNALTHYISSNKHRVKELAKYLLT